MTLITENGESVDIEFTPFFKRVMDIYFCLALVVFLLALIMALRDMRKKAKIDNIPLWKECLKTYLYYGTFHLKKKDDD